MDKLSERRNSFRFEVKGLEVYSKNVAKLVGLSNDLSANGISINSTTEFEPGTKLLLEFALPGSNRSIRTYGEVRRVSKVGSDTYGIGVQFMLINEADRQKLFKYLGELIEDKPERPLNSDTYSLADFVESTSDDLFDKTLDLQGFLYDMNNKGYLTYHRLLLSPCKNRVVIDDKKTGESKEMVMMGSNSYLGLSTHPEVIRAGEEALKIYGSGSGAATVLAGNYDIHQKLEKKLASMVGCEDAFLFLSGYTANIGCIQALIRNDDLAILDRLAHASILDGAIFSSGKFRTFKHNDMEALERVLKTAHDKYNGKLIVVDAVYSMESDIAPLPDISEIAKNYGAKVMIDDAHGMGVLGKNGYGTVNHFGLEGEIDIVMGTLGKAWGCLGGFIASTNEVVNYLRYYGRSSFFSTALPPAVAASVLKAIEVVENDPSIIGNLWRNIEYMKTNLSEMGYVIPTGQNCAIIPLIVGDDLTMRKMTSLIHQKGIFLNSIPFPAVPKGAERFRLSIMATHTREDLDKTLNVLEEVGKKFKVIGAGRRSNNINTEGTASTA